MKKKSENKYELLPFEYDGIGVMMEGFAVIIKDDRLGFINIKGEIIIPIEYDNYSFTTGFKEGLAVVRKDKKFGVIDGNNQIIVPFIYDMISDFQNGISKVYKEGYYGFINKDGEIIIPIEYENCRGDFQDDVIPIKKEGKWGVINVSGKILIPFRYDNIYYLGNGLFGISENSKTGLFNKDNECLLSFEYDSFYGFENGISIFSRNGKQGAINNKGEIIIPEEYEDLRSYKKLTVVKKDGKYGLYNNRKLLMPCEYDRFFDIDVKEFPVFEKDVKEGLINSEGNIIVSCEYENIDWTNGKITSVSQNSKYGIVKDNVLVIPCEYDKIVISNRFKIIALKKDGIVKLKDFDLNEIPGIYEEVYAFQNGDYLKVYQNGKSGIIGKDGALILKCEYKIDDLYNNWAVLEKEVKKGIWDDGHFILDCIYDNIKYDGYMGNYPNKPIIVGVKKEDKWAIFEKGDQILPFEYAEVLSVDKDFPTILKNEGDKQCELINKKGEALISVKKEKYDEITCYNRHDKGQGLFEISYGKKTGLYNEITEDILVPIKYKNINILTDRLFAVSDKDKVGLFGII